MLRSPTSQMKARFIRAKPNGSFTISRIPAGPLFSEILNLRHNLEPQPPYANLFSLPSNLPYSAPWEGAILLGFEG
jgi:hypothetical protein